MYTGGFDVSVVVAPAPALDTVWSPSCCTQSDFITFEGGGSLGPSRGRRLQMGYLRPLSDWYLVLLIAVQ